MDKYTKAHNKMVFATGEHKTRAKLAKSKHGWLKIAMGVTFASTSLFAVSHPTHAETQTPVKDAAVSAPANHQEAGTTETPTDNGSNQTDSTTEQEAVAPTDQTKSVTEQTNKQPSDEPAATTDSKKDQQPNVATEPSQPSATKEQDLTDQSVGTDGTATAETNQLADQPTTSDAATNTVAPNEEKQTSVVEPTKTETNTNSTDPNTTDQQVKTNDQSTVTTDEHPVTSNQADVKSTDHQQTEPVTQQTATPVISLAAADTNSVSGTYTVSGTQNVRDGAGLGYNVTGQLNAGDTINYDGQQSADGYTWLHYTNYAGQDRWVAQLVSATNNHSAFIDSLAAGAIETWNRYGVLPSVSIAQAIVESGWGGSAPGNNLFGIKGEYNGQYTIQKTQEFVNGRYITIYDKFRAYPSFAESIMDHGNFLYVNSRYANLLGVRDAYQVTQMLQRDGYATSPTYASTLMSVINANNLTRFDQNLGTPTGGATNNNQGDSTVTNDVSGSYTLPGAQNVRDGASLNAGITGQLEAGYTVNYQGTKDADGYTWLHYTNYAGQNRWVAQLGTATDTPSTPSDNGNQPQPGTEDQGSYTLSGAQNVRDGASLNAGITGQLEAGYTVNYQGTKDADGYTWLHYTNYAGQDRWVAQLGTATDTPSTPSDNGNQSQPGTEDQGSYTLSGAQNVRDGASLNAGITGQLEAGYTVNYQGTKDADGYTWLHYTNYAGQDRWVAKIGTATDTPSTPSDNGNQPQPGTEDQGSYTLSGAQNVRDGASLNAGITGQLEAGYTVNYQGTKDADGYTWLHYTNYAGQDRWVAKIGGTSGTSVANPEATNNQSGSYTVSSPQNVRNDATTSASITGQLNVGDTISYDKTRAADGYTWLHYTNYAGQDRWIAQLNSSYAVQQSNNSNTAQTALRVASAQAGNSYAWGGSSPASGFDCSGLIYYAYQQAGKTVPRTAAGQLAASQRISQQQAQTGDLVFFQNGSGVYHSGFYLGNGRMLDAQNRGVIYNDLMAYFPGQVFFGRLS